MTSKENEESLSKDTVNQSVHVEDIGLLELDRADVTEGPATRVAKTRALLAYLLFGLLAVINVVLLFLLADHRITTQEFGTVAGVLIAPVVGLLGAATGYYYGKGDR